MGFVLGNHRKLVREQVSGSVLGGVGALTREEQVSKSLLGGVGTTWN